MFVLRTNRILRFLVRSKKFTIHICKPRSLQLIQLAPQRTIPTPLIQTIHPATRIEAINDHLPERFLDNEPPIAFR